MTSDFVAVRHEFKEDIRIVPIFDAHIGAQECNISRLEKVIEYIKNTKNVYTILGGDLLNNGIKSSVTDVYSEAMRPREQKELLYKMLLPIKDKILAGHRGNHEYRSSKEVDSCPVYDVFARLGIEDRYRQDAVFMTITMKKWPASHNNPSYMICSTHGAGSGIASSANKAEKFINSMEGVDLVLMGHTHKPVTFPTSKLVYDSRCGKVVQKQFHVVVASSFLGYGDYPVRKMLGPTAQVMQEIILSAKEKQIRVIQ